jgi:hypothetical protein
MKGLVEDSEVLFQCYVSLTLIIIIQKVYLFHGLARLFHAGSNVIPRWKIFILAWIQIYCIVLLSSYTWNPLLREYNVPLPIGNGQNSSINIIYVQRVDIIIIISVGIVHHVERFLHVLYFHAIDMQEAT